MNRKQKIIVSITGIVLVGLILIGLTYAYFLTQITGNTNEKSISVSTASLVLEYGENTNVVQGINNAEPGYSVEKIFTATNKGNSTVTYGAALENIVNELTRQEDLVYTLTCTSYLKEGFSLASDGTITGTVDGTCNGVNTEKQFPSTSTMSIMTTNTIDTTHTHAYKLTVTYKEMGEDQSTDMNKNFSAKVNIADTNAITVNNPYKNDTGTLKKTIIDNAMLKLNGTEYSKLPKTQPAVTTSLEDEKEISTTPDDYGTSYYYRGGVEDNYVNFAGMCWKIVRIEGDGSTKLILEDRSAECNSSSYTGNWSDGTKISFGKDSNEKADFLNYSGGLADSLKDFQMTLATKVGTGKILNNYLKVDDWCFDHNVTSISGYGYDNNHDFVTEKDKATLEWHTVENYGSATRISDKNPSLKCTGTKLNKFKDNTGMYVGTLTADEVVYAGAAEVENGTHYLINNYSQNNDLWWNTLSPSYFVDENICDYVYLLNHSGQFYSLDLELYVESRPAVTLKSDTQISGGNGTKENPYVIE